MKTIIYHAITTYHMLEFIVHNAYFKHEDAILLIPQSLANYYPNYKYLEENELMAKVVIMPDIVTGKDEEDVVEKIGAFVHNNLTELSVEGVEVHVAGGQFMFSAYLINKGIPFVFYEEASGILSRAEKLQDNVRIGNPLMYGIASKNGMFDGSNPLVLHRVCNKKAQVAGFEFREDDEDFNIVGILKQLDADEVKKIIHFYTEIDEYDIKEKSCLLLTQHFANLSILTFEQQVLLYQIFADYFLEGYSLVFKPHPFDFTNYISIFDDCMVIRERFPSEFLPFMFKKCPDKVATISSTSIYDISSIFSESLEMDFAFEKDYIKMNKYYVSEQIIRQLLNRGYSINLIGVNEAYYRQRYSDSERVYLYEGIENIEEFESAQVYVFDGSLSDTVLDKIYSENINCIFLDVEENRDFYRYQYRKLWNRMAIVNIAKTNLRSENVYVDMQEEHIYVFGDIKGGFTMEEEKVLNNMGIVLKVKKFDCDDYERMALQGKLEATEKRLAYYIDKCENLEKRLQNLKEKGYPLA